MSYEAGTTANIYVYKVHVHTHTHTNTITHTHTHTLLWHDGSASNDIYNEMYRRSNNIIWNFCVSPFIRNIDATRPSITG